MDKTTNADGQDRLRPPISDRRVSEHWRDPAGDSPRIYTPIHTDLCPPDAASRVEDDECAPEVCEYLRVPIVAHGACTQVAGGAGRKLLARLGTLREFVERVAALLGVR